MVISCILYSNIFCALLVCLIYLIKKILGKHLSIKCNYYIWFSVLLSLGIVFIPTDILTDFNLPALSIQSYNISFTDITDKSNYVLSSDNNWMQDFSYSVNRFDISNLTNIIIPAWVIGILIFTISYSINIVKLKKLKNNAIPISSEIFDIFKKCLCFINISKNIQIYQTEERCSPFSFGIFYPCIIMPKEIDSNFSIKDIENIFLHEIMHIKSHDTILNHICCVFKVIFWFNPFIWFAFTQMKYAREVFCDYKVMELLPNKKSRLDYGHTLLNFATKTVCFNNCVNSIGGTKKELKNRVNQIVKYKHDSKLKVIASTVLVFVIVLFTVVQIPIFSAFAYGNNTYTPTNSISVNEENYENYFGDNDGSVVLYSQKNDVYTIYNQEKSMERVSPCSTYKIYSALNALENNIITPDNNLLLWNNEITEFSEWNENHDLESAMQNSVNWYFQELDNALGIENLNDFYSKIEYGNKIIQNTSDYWMESTLKISVLEQVELMKNFYYNEWNFNSENINTVKDAIFLETSNGSSLFGKTGSGMVNGKQINGWFIGYVETIDDVYFFAINIQGEDGITGSVAAQIMLSILEDKEIYVK